MTQGAKASRRGLRMCVKGENNAKNGLFDLFFAIFGRFWTENRLFFNAISTYFGTFFFFFCRNSGHFFYLLYNLEKKIKTNQD
jgi:hypothetical protein